MGNHDVGIAFFVAASMLKEEEIDTMPKERALELLDVVGNFYTGTDAEFDDHLNANTKLG